MLIFKKVTYFILILYFNNKKIYKYIIITWGKGEDIISWYEVNYSNISELTCFVDVYLLYNNKPQINTPSVI